MRTLISGLSGFTGQYLQAELRAHHHEVVGLDSDLTNAPALEAEVCRVQPDWVVHLAGIAFVGHGEPNDFYRVNLMGTRNLLAALAACSKSPACVLLASSANVYGNATEGVLDETAAPSPANDYAVSKLAMEHMARLWMDKLPIVIARPFNYTGVGQSETFLLPKIVAHYRRRDATIELGNLDVVRDFSDVRVVAKKYLRLLQAGVQGHTFNVCSGVGSSLLDVIAIMNDLAGYQMEVKVNPQFVRTNEVRRLVGSEQRLHAKIGQCPAIAIAETLEWMYRA